MKNNYSPIITHSTTRTFFDYIDAIDLPQVDYFAIGIQNSVTKQSTSLMSLPEWQAFFTENRFAHYDPVRRATLFTQRTIIPFCEIDCVDNFGKEIMRQRAKFGIKNGIIFAQRFKKHNFMITLGTNFSCFEPFDFIQRYHEKIILLKTDLINLVGKETELFLPNSNHLSVDAK